MREGFGRRRWGLGFSLIEHWSAVTSARSDSRAWGASWFACTLAPHLMLAPFLIGANISSDVTRTLTRPNDHTPHEGVYYLVRVGEVGIGRVEL